MYKRIPALLIASLIIVGMFAGCQASSDQNSEPSSSSAAPVAASSASADSGTPKSAVNPNDTFPIVDEKITISVFAPNYFSADLTTNEFTKWYEEKTNIHIEWDLAGASDIKEKRSLLLASNNYPDVFLGAFVTKDEEMMYGPQGIFIPLNGLIDEYSVYFKQALSDIPIMKNGITTPDGNIYTLPRINECYHCKFYRRAWINQTWLDELNLTVPETTDELYEVLKAFKEKDPNGNGIADEIPLTGSTGDRANVADFFINSFIYNDGQSNDRIIMTDGKVDVNFNKPEFRQALEYMNKLYSEGLVDSSAFTQDDTQLLQLGSNPDAAVIGVVPCFTPWGFAGVDSDAGNRSRDYVALKPLKGPDGAQFASYFPYQYTFATGFFAITDKCGYPEAAFRMIDYLYSQEGTLLSVYGIEGVDWRYAEAGEIGINGKPAIWAETRDASAANQLNNAWGEMGPSYRDDNFRSGRTAPPDDPWDSEVRLYNETKDKMEGFQPAEVYPPTYMAADKVAEVSRMRTAINDYVKESIARFVTGDMNLTSDWDKYLTELDSLGVQQYIAELQAAYEAQYNR